MNSPAPLSDILRTVVLKRSQCVHTFSASYVGAIVHAKSAERLMNGSEKVVWLSSAKFLTKFPTVVKGAKSDNTCQ